MHGRPNNSQAKEQKPVPGKQHRDQLWKYLKQLIKPIYPIRGPITTTIIIYIPSLHQLNYTITIRYNATIHTFNCNRYQPTKLLFSLLNIVSCGFSIFHIVLHNWSDPYRIITVSYGKLFKAYHTSPHECGNP